MKERRSCWVLEAFEKPPGDHLVHQWVLPDFTEADIRRLAHLPADSHPYGGHQVTEEMVPELRRFTHAAIDLSKYDYFLELQSVG